MHQPLTVAHEECVRLVNGEIIHLLRCLDIPTEPDGACCAVSLLDFIACFQVFGVGSAFVFDVEGVFRCGLQFFAVNDEVDDDFVRVVDCIGDLVPAEGVCWFVPGEDVVSDLDQADGSVAFIGGDFGVRTEILDVFGDLRTPLASKMTYKLFYWLKNSQNKAH